MSFYLRRWGLGRSGFRTPSWRDRRRDRWVVCTPVETHHWGHRRGPWKRKEMIEWNRKSYFTSGVCYDWWGTKAWNQRWDMNPLTPNPKPPPLPRFIFKIIWTTTGRGLWSPWSKTSDHLAPTPYDSTPWNIFQLWWWRNKTNVMEAWMSEWMERRWWESEKGQGGLILTWAMRQHNRGKNGVVVWQQKENRERDMLREE